MSIEEYIKYLKFEKRYSNHTLLAYQNDLESFELFCDFRYHIEIKQATHQIIRDWFSSLMDDNVNAKSIRRKASALNGYFKYIIRSGDVIISPMDKVPLPKIIKRLPQFVEEKNMLNLLEADYFEDNEQGVRDFTIISIFYHTGIRLSELINLKESDIDFSKKVLKVTGKRNKQRIIPFSDELLETVLKYITYRGVEVDGGYLFGTNKMKKMYPNLLYRVVNKYLSSVTTLTQRSPHVIRHTFATHLLNNGAELNAIKELLGHANLSATQVYTHNSMEKIKSIYKQAHPRA